MPRDLETVIPPIFIALFFFIVNIGTLQPLTEQTILGFDFEAFQMPILIVGFLLGVRFESKPGTAAARLTKARGRNPHLSAKAAGCR